MRFGVLPGVNSVDVSLLDNITAAVGYLRKLSAILPFNDPSSSYGATMRLQLTISLFVYKYRGLPLGLCSSLKHYTMKSDCSGSCWDLA